MLMFLIVLLNVYKIFGSSVCPEECLLGERNVKNGTSESCGRFSLGERCEAGLGSVLQCKTAFSSCQNGLCRCLNGFRNQGNHCIPEKYVYVLQQHPDLGSINGGVWHFDYEPAAYDSFRAVFPEAEVSGCIFHYGSAINKRIGTLGLQPAYELEPVRRFFRRLIGLALLPPELVYQAATSILADPPQTGNPAWTLGIENFREYFQWWLRDMDFIRLWNHYSSTGPRTTNNAEGWHNGLSQKLPHEHPDLSVFIVKLQKWHHSDSVRAQGLIQGNREPRPRNQRQVRNDNEIAVAKLNFAGYIQNPGPGGIDINRIFQYLDFVQHRLGNHLRV